MRLPAPPGGTVGLGSKYCDHLQDELDKLRSTFNWQVRAAFICLLYTPR